MFSRNVRRWAGGAALAVAAAVAAVPVTPGTALAETPLFGSGEWADPQGAFSSCYQVAATTVSCDHFADAGDLSTPLTSHCRTEGVSAAGVAVVGACHVTLSGITSGAGKVVGENFAPACQTNGLLTGTVTFADSTGFDYPDVDVTIINKNGVAEFAGQVVNSENLLVASTSGSFTFACGSPIGAAGSFKGTYVLA